MISLLLLIGGINMARMFNRRHYIAIARVISDSSRVNDRGEVGRLVEAISNMFTADSNNFDREAFGIACRHYNTSITSNSSNSIMSAYKAAKHVNECTCDYISPGAAALHAVFHGVDGPLPKLRNPECPVHN